jgi:hypothetical protein
MRDGSPHTRFQHPTIDLAEQTWRANTGARKAVRAATELVCISRAMREEREHWRLVWADRMANPDRFLSRCVYCARMRTPEEDWVAIPAQVGRLLQDLNVPFLSHGICPGCLDSHLSVQMMQVDGGSRFG